MNSARANYKESEMDYSSEAQRGDKADKAERPRRMQYSRSSRPAVSHNGMHRRRNKRFAW